MNAHDLLLRIDVALTELENLKDELLTDVNAFSIANSVIIMICDECEVDYDIMLSASRKKMNVIARTIAVHELRQRKYTYTKIGELLNRDHSSCVYAMRVYDDRMKYDPEFRLYQEKVERRLYNERG